jgi:two-component system nitrogen regulation response regulator GlnG
LGVESKTLLPVTVDKLKRLDWPGNVRQLENTARWLTVMASSQEIHVEDLPVELTEGGYAQSAVPDWRKSLRQWTRDRLQRGERGILNEALPAFESIMIETALEHTGGRRQDAAKLLGWGRNTLTRKIRELGLETGTSEEA